MVETRRLTHQEQKRRGVALRKRFPRSAQAPLFSWKGRDPIAILAAQNTDRVQELVGERRTRMSESPFAFYRGAGAVMAADLGHSEHTGHTVVLCGDAHLANFGVFASAERTLIFDVNDFDETYPGPWEWDVKRLASSIAVLGRHMGLKRKAARAAAAEVAKAYRIAIGEYAQKSARECYFTQLRADDLLTWTQGIVASGKLSKRAEKRVAKGLDKARQNTSERAWTKLGVSTDSAGRLTIADAPPLTTRLADLASVGSEDAAKLAAQYLRTVPPDVAELLRSYVFDDAVLRVVGVGSVGTRCFVTLWTEPDNAPLFLQIKEATDSVLKPYVTSDWEEGGGYRVVRGQRIMQSSSDPFLGALEGPESRSFYVRQFRDMKGSVDLTKLSGKSALVAYGVACAQALARAHAQGGTAAVISGYLGRAAKTKKVDRAFAEFADSYADQTEADHAALLAATDQQWHGTA